MYKYLIDTSYLIYYTSFSAFKYYKWKNELDQNVLNQDFNPILDDSFCQILKYRIKQNLLRPLQKLFLFIPESDYVFCLDCSRKNNWRKGIYPEYKINRDLGKKGFTCKEYDIGKVFEYVYDIILPNIIEETKAISLRCQIAQGDDLIAVLTQKYLNQNKNIIILTGDKDIIQLYDPQKVKIINIQGEQKTPKKQLEHAIKKTIIGEVSNKDFLLFKILIGDPSDDIPNVRHGIGPKKAYQFVRNEQKLKQFLKEDRLNIQGFIRNKKLISMTQIPQDVSKLILELLKQEEQKKNVE